MGVADFSQKFIEKVDHGLFLLCGLERMHWIQECASQEHYTKHPHKNPAHGIDLLFHSILSRQYKTSFTEVLVSAQDKLLIMLSRSLKKYMG